MLGCCKPGRRLRLGLEAVRAACRRPDPPAQDHLQGHQSVEPDLPRLVDDAHAAAAQFAENLVAGQGRQSRVAATAAVGMGIGAEPFGVRVLAGRSDARGRSVPGIGSVARGAWSVEGGSDSGVGSLMGGLGVPLLRPRISFSCSTGGQPPSREYCPQLAALLRRCLFRL